jgi:DNA-binding transcriptional LysR family regulator
MPTLRQIEYWVAAVEEGSFGRAARRMHVSQPSLSQQVKVLEAELGGELFERLPGGIRLTPAGKEFLPHARASVAAAREAVRAARAALEMRGGELEIATVGSVAPGILPDAIALWRERFPDASVRLREFSRRRLAEEAVASGEVEIGIGPPPADWNGPLRRLGWEELVVVPQPAARAAGTDAAARLAEAEVGTTLVPSSVVPLELRERALRCVPAVGRELSVYARAKFSPQAAAFVDLLDEVDWAEPPPDALVIA